MSLIMAKNSKIPVDVVKDSPGYYYGGVTKGNYWRDKLDNNDFLHIFSRNGLGRKLLTKFYLEMFKKGVGFNNSSYESINQEFGFEKIVSYAWLNSNISGYSLIYVGYSDIENISDYNNPAPINTKPEYFYVIPRAWVNEDIKQKGMNEDLDFYSIYQENGGTFNIHKSRIIRVSVNDDEKSYYEPIFNSLEVADNILWGVGQTIWRSAQGFPVLTVENPKMINDPKDNKTKNEIQKLVEDGALRDINTETGFIGDARYKFDFIGAEGKALKPMEYWDITLEFISSSTDIPKDVLKGVSAGAITGSETNLKQYYSMLRSKQLKEVQPIYDMLFATFGVVLKDEDYFWYTLYEQDKNEEAMSLKVEAEALTILVNSGIISTDEARKTLIERNEWLEVSVSPNIKTDSFKIDSRHYDLDFVRKQYDSGHVVDSEESSLPLQVQKVESSFMRETAKLFKDTSKLTSNVFEAFNTDSEE